MYTVNVQVLTLWALEISNKMKPSWPGAKPCTVGRKPHVDEGLAVRPRLYVPCVCVSVCWKHLQRSGRYSSSLSPSSAEKSWSRRICWPKVEMEIFKMTNKGQTAKAGQSQPGVQWIGCLSAAWLAGSSCWAFTPGSSGERTLQAPAGVYPHHLPFHSPALSFHILPSFCETSLVLNICVYFSSEYLPSGEEKGLQIKQ